MNFLTRLLRAVCPKTAALPLLFCGAVAVLSQAGAQPAPGDAKLRDDLDVAYNTWRLHMIRGNYDGWRASTSAYRQVRVRNLAVSEKRPFPASLFGQHMAPPALGSLIYVGSVVNGPTAAATYYGKIDLGLGQEPSDSNALVLLFTNERGKWKYDQARFFNLSRLPAVKDRLKRGDATVLMEQDGFQPLGSIPPIPQICPSVKYIAKILVDCPGRTVKANVNGISDHEFDNTRQAEIISGGLRDGANSITLNFSDSPNGQKGAVLAEVYIMPEIQGNLPARAYTYFVPPDKQPQNGTVIINVTPELISTMDPHKKAPAPTAGRQRQ